MGFGIINIMLMSVFERTREFGVLMAIGMTGPKVFGLIMAEAATLGAVGSLIGAGCGAALIAITGTAGVPFGAMAEGLGAFGVDAVLYPFVDPELYLGMVIMVVLTSLIAALYPARQILKKRPADALAAQN
jgi:ABC-type antimicrobial peptide transport system permease subunit